MMRFYLLDPASGQPVPCTCQEWAKAFEGRTDCLRQGQPDPWRVDETRLADGGEVSTVFLGLDHAWAFLGPDSPPAPVLWETIWFDPFGQAQEMKRYTSLEAARAGHAQMVQRASQEPPVEVN